MTWLKEKVPPPPPTEGSYLGLVDEVNYWPNQPEVNDDPVLQALAYQTRDLLKEGSSPEDTYLTEEVSKNILLLRSGVAEANLR